MMPTSFSIKPYRLRSLVLDAYEAYRKKEYDVVMYISGTQTIMKPFSFYIQVHNKWCSLKHFDSKEELEYILDDFFSYPTGVYIEQSVGDNFAFPTFKKHSLFLEGSEYIRHFIVNDTLFIETKELGLFSINFLEHAKDKNLA